MKKIHIKICDFDPNNEYSYGYFLLKILRKYYNVELSEKPDYIFYHESSFEHLKYNGIKIFYTGENISPNFNLCDYAISFDYINFHDRHYRLPIYFVAVFYNKEELKLAGKIDMTKQIVFSKNDLLKKTEFCSFVYSNYLANDSRAIIFDKLSGYKKVNAGGKYLNNIGNKIDNKLEFELKHKFSIAFENSSRAGYTTEKIVSSFVAKTIPIYWGNPEIGKEFNTKRFINCHDFNDFDEVVNRVKEIDNDDDLYLKIINEPITVNSNSFQKTQQSFDAFLINIIEQKLDLAKRRTINPIKALEIEKYENIISKHIKRQAVLRKIITKLYQPFKNIKVLEIFKQKYFRRKLSK